MKIRYLLLLLFMVAPDLTMALPWSRDMFNQPSVKPQESYPLPVPTGIVSIQGAEKETDSRAKAVRIVNPVRPEAASIARGKTMYNIYCAVCHGKSGKGDGIVGKKFIPPTDLTGSYIRMKPDGDVYFTIRNGGLAVMPRYGDAITATDRWHIINYIRTRFSDE